MKIIHTADIHLNSKIDSAFPADIAEQRRSEVRQTFSRLVDYAKNNAVRAVLLCGDVFDVDSPFDDALFFYSALSAAKDVTFFYLRGNHDSGGLRASLPENLRLFGSEWSHYDLDGVHIWGIEGGENIPLPPPVDKSALNIAMLHGLAGEGANFDINLKKFSGSGVDYLALGHIHKPSAGTLGQRGEWAYCGCLEGRGFDETGERGFILLDIDPAAARLSHTFIPFAKRTIHECDADISGAKTSHDAGMAVRRAVTFNRGDIYRINLVGECDYIRSLERDVSGLIKDGCYFLTVKDKTVRTVDIDKYLGENSLEGEFVRLTLARADLDEKQKREIISCGLRALTGGEI